MAPYIGGGKGFYLEDVGGSFKKFLREAPRVTRSYIHDAVEKTAFALQRRMEFNAPQGPDAPHIKNHVTYKRRGQRADVGFLNATEPAAPGSDASIADVALYNEYRPNGQPFMRPSAEAEDKNFIRRVSDAMRQTERDLSAGGGLV